MTGRGSHRNKLRAAAAAALLAPLLLLSQSGPQGWYKQSNFYQSQESRVARVNQQTKQIEPVFQFTPEYELSLGNQAYQSLVSGQPIVQDPQIQGYFEKLVGRIVNTTPGPPFPFRVTVVQAPDVVNAVTPPGHVVIYSGLIARSESEAMLAATMAHELAHNYGHHVARRMIRGYQAQMIADAALQALQDKNELVRRLGFLGSQIGVGLFVRAYSRFEEKEADLYGVHLLYNAGFNPTWMSEMFLRMAKETPRQPPKFLSTHPPLEDRASYISQYLEKFALNRELQVDSAEYQGLRARLGLPQTPVATVAGEYRPAAGMPALRSDSGPATPPRPPQPPAPAAPASPTVDSRDALQAPVGYPPAPASPPAPAGPPAPREPPAPASPPAPGPPPGTEPPPPSPAGVPPPPVALPTPPPASSGVLVWSGRIEQGEVFTIDGDRPSTGRMNGALPGLPVQLEIDAREFAIVEAPAPSNNWKRLVIRSRNKRHTVITVQWKIIAPGGF